MGAQLRAPLKPPVHHSTNICYARAAQQERVPRFGRGAPARLADGHAQHARAVQHWGRRGEARAGGARPRRQLGHVSPHAAARDIGER